jgi:predicted NUDIX family phosphoesterase
LALRGQAGIIRVFIANVYEPVRSFFMPQDEQVLVVERRILERVGMFQGLVFEVEPYLRALFAPGVPQFLPRAQVEKDPSLKQLIPYVLMAHAGRYLSYVRGKRAGETRLVGNRSIGIGGHINPTDDLPLFNDNFRGTYEAAVAREVAEEVDIQTPHADRIVALLNDDSNEVGQVHLGVVHLWTLQAPEVNRREQMITQMAFLTPHELSGLRETMETWSRICLDNLAAMTA